MKEKVSCKYCNKIFLKNKHQINKTKNHFCNRSCSASYNNCGHQRNKPIALTCCNCNIQYFRSKSYRSKKYCFTCYVEQQKSFKEQTIGDCRKKLSVLGKHQSWLHSHVRSYNRSWNKKLTKLPCQVCGYSKHVELAHIKSISSFDDNAKLTEINNKNNILVLCPNHHWEFDNNLISIRNVIKN